MMMLCPKPKLAKTNNSIRSPSLSMEIPSRQDKKVYVHYNHTDPCSHARWTARECYDFMYQRKWKPVADFYSGLVNGQFSLSNLFGSERQVSQETSIRDDAEDLGASEERKVVNGKDKSGRWARMNFKIVLSYHGGSFDGWQKQPDLNTVQGLVEKSLGRFVDDRKVKQLIDKSFLPVEGCAIVAGRTDKGVTALQQVCSFYTWRKDVSSVDIEEVINSIAPGQIRAVCVSEVSRAFHPNFSSKWRRYLYIFPIDDDEEEVEDGGEKTISIARTCNGEELKSLCNGEIKKINDYVASNDEEEVGGNKPRSFSIIRVNQLLKQLEGKSLSYRVFARDTKASRSMGPPTECFVFHARAAEARLPHTSNQVSDHPSKKQFQFGEEGVQVLCVELVANRFLRKMVRVLVATSIREAAAGAEEDALLKLMDATCRRATAPPAPPDGLCLVDVGYSDFRPEICLIS